MKITCTDANGAFIVDCGTSWPPKPETLAKMTPALRKRVQGVLDADKFEAPKGEPIVMTGTFEAAPRKPKPGGLRFAKPAFNIKEVC